MERNYGKCRMVDKDHGGGKQETSVRGKLRNREWLRRHTKICINGKRNTESRDTGMGNCGSREREREKGKSRATTNCN